MNLSMPPATLPVLLLVALGLAFALQNRRTAARAGRSPNRFGASETAHDFVGRVYRIGGAILLLFLIARTAAPGIDNAAGLVPGLARPLIAWTGMGSLAAGGAVILAAQAQMGASWRIGLDPERTGLVTSGLFAWSRSDFLRHDAGGVRRVPRGSYHRHMCRTHCRVDRILGPDPHGGGTPDEDAWCILRNLPHIGATMDRLARYLGRSLRPPALACGSQLIRGMCLNPA